MWVVEWLVHWRVRRVRAGKLIPNVGIRRVDPLRGIVGREDRAPCVLESPRLEKHDGIVIAGIDALRRPLASWDTEGIATSSPGTWANASLCCDVRELEHFEQLIAGKCHNPNVRPAFDRGPIKVCVYPSCPVIGGHDHELHASRELSSRSRTPAASLWPQGQRVGLIERAPTRVQRQTQSRTRTDGRQTMIFHARRSENVDDNELMFSIAAGPGARVNAHRNEVLHFIISRVGGAPRGRPHTLTTNASAPIRHYLPAFLPPACLTHGCSVISIIVN